MRKKFLAIVIVIFIFLNSGISVFANSDVTAPTIKNVEWSHIGDINVGEELVLTIDAYDSESGIGDGNLVYIEHKTTKIYKVANIHYDDVQKKYIAKFQITNDMQNGEWGIDYITFYDKAGNRSDAFEYELGIDKRINVIGGQADIQPPIFIDMEWSHETINIGERLEITLKAYDESGISDHNLIYIENLATQIYKVSNLTYNSEKDVYEAYFDITEDMQSGKWGLDYFYLEDTVGNRKYFNNEELEKPFYVDIIGGEEDITPPKLDSIKVSHENIQMGEKLTIEIEAHDDESGISGYNLLYIENKETEIYKVTNLIYDNLKECYIAEFLITPDMQYGDWGIDYLYLEDNAGNREYYHGYEMETPININVLSPFGGVQNCVIKLNENFNVRENVTVTSYSDGDITESLIVYGDVNVNEEGIYLIKYSAPSEMGTDFVSYRWITVVKEVYEEDEWDGDPFFSKDVAIVLPSNIDNSSINITQDGNRYEFNGERIKKQGKYNIAFNNTIENNNISKVKGGISFILDTTVPEIISVNNIKINEGETIEADKFINAKDNYSKIRCKFISEPNWSQLGLQNIDIRVSDLAGNYIDKRVQINIFNRYDLNRDSNVDIADISLIARNYNKTNIDSEWDSRFDFNKDNVIDIYDIVNLTKEII